MNDRVERARQICVWLAEQVHQVVPPGLGAWDRCWILVEKPSAEFLDALHAWEQTGAPEDKAAVQDAGAAVIAAWKLAGEEWQRSRQAVPEEAAR
jgi:hypothetical protein